MRRLIGIILFLLVSTPAFSQTLTQCGSFDTTTTWTSDFALLSNCTIVTGPAGTVTVVASGETECSSSGQVIRMFIAPGVSQVGGSNFLAQVSGGVLSLNSVVPGLGVSPYLIIPGQQYLAGGTGINFAPTLITGQIDGVTGALGRYNIANSSLSEPANTNLYALAPLPAGMTAITPAMSQNGCNPGFVITTLAGTFQGAPNSQYWIGMSMHSGATSQTSVWNNSQWEVLAQ